MPVTWRDDSETYRAIVIQIVLGQVTADPQGFKEKTKPTVMQNSKSRRKIKKRLVDVLDWGKLCEALPDKVTPEEARKIWERSFDSAKLIKGGWTRTEDTLLDELVKAFGTKHWAKFCAYIPGRNGKQCRERWLNHLNPNLKKGPWEQHELDTLVKFQRVYGNSWARIAQHLPGRAENAVKNQWNSMMHRSFSNMMNTRGGQGNRRGGKARGKNAKTKPGVQEHDFFSVTAFSKLQDTGGSTHSFMSDSGKLEHSLGSPLSFGGLVSRGSTGDTFASLGSLGAPSSPERALVNDVYSAMSRSAKMRALASQINSARASLPADAALDFNQHEEEPVDLNAPLTDDEPAPSGPGAANRRRASAKRRSSGASSRNFGLNNTQEGFSGNSDHNILGLTHEFVSREIQRQSLFDSMRLDPNAVRQNSSHHADKRMRHGRGDDTIDGINVGVNNLRLQQQSPSGSRPRRRAPGVDFNSAWEDLEGQADLNSRQPWNFAGRPERPRRGRTQIGQWASVRPGSSGSRGSRGSRGSNGRPSSRDRFANAFGQGSRPNSNEHSDWALGNGSLSSQPGSAEAGSLGSAFGGNSGRLSLAKFSLGSQGHGGFSPSSYFGGGAVASLGGGLSRDASPSGSPFARAFASGGIGLNSFSPTNMQLSPLTSLGRGNIFSAGPSSLSRLSPTAQQLQQLQQAAQSGRISEEQKRELKNKLIHRDSEMEAQTYSPRSTQHINGGGANLKQAAAWNLDDLNVDF